MSSITSESSSSDDEVCIYLNSVARLKALKQEQLLLRTNNNMQDTEINETAEIVKPQKCQEKVIEIDTEEPRRTCSMMRTRRKNIAHKPKEQSEISRVNLVDSDSDLEIVSVEEHQPDYLEIVSVEEHQPDCILTHEKSINENEDENYEMNIKIMWKSRHLHSINVCRNEKFRKVFEYLAHVEKVPIDEIIIMTNKNRIIKKNDTPASLDLSVIDILEGGIVKKNDVNSRGTAEEDEDEDICVIKIQTGTKKNLSVRVRRDQNFKSLLEKCSQELSVEESKIKLYFDGELLSPTDTPDSLDIEDEACFDIQLPS